MSAARGAGEVLPLADLFNIDEAPPAAARAAIDRLVGSLRASGLAVQEHHDPSGQSERALWIDCRPERAELDTRLVYSILGCGWQPDLSRLRRAVRRYDAQRLRHVDSDATITVVICVPQPPFPEAA